MASRRSWINNLSLGEAYTLGKHDGHPVAMLFRDSGGAVLRWWIDANPARNEQVNILLHLTDDEAEKVIDEFDTPGTGLLEPIRRNIANNSCWITITSDQGVLESFIPMWIGRRGSESANVDTLLRYASSRFMRSLFRSGRLPGRGKRVADFTSRSDRVLREIATA